MFEIGKLYKLNWPENLKCTLSIVDLQTKRILFNEKNKQISQIIMEPFLKHERLFLCVTDAILVPIFLHISSNNFVSAPNHFFKPLSEKE